MRFKGIVIPPKVHSTPKFPKMPCLAFIIIWWSLLNLLKHHEGFVNSGYCGMGLLAWWLLSPCTRRSSRWRGTCPPGRRRYQRGWRAARRCTQSWRGHSTLDISTQIFQETIWLIWPKSVTEEWAQKCEGFKVVLVIDKELDNDKGVKNDEDKTDVRKGQKS